MRVNLLIDARGVWLSFVDTASAQVPAGNHYLCRKVKDEQIPAKFVPQVGVAVTDQIGSDSCDLKKAFLLCSSLSAKNGPVAQPDPLLHYVCYKAKCGQKPAVSFSTTDQFGPLQLSTKKPFLLCAPASKTPA